jgi:hypothetical protein
MKYKLIIDINFQKYQPQFNLSKILDIESVNVDKFKKVYLYIDNINLFYNNFSLFDSNKTIFLFNKNIVFKNFKMFSIEIVNQIEEKIDIKDMIIKNQYIKDYLNGINNKEK